MPLRGPAPPAAVVSPLELRQLYERLDDPVLAAIDAAAAPGPVWVDNPLAGSDPPLASPGREDPVLRTLAEGLGPGNAKQLAAQKAQRLQRHQQQQQQAKEAKRLAALQAKEEVALLAAAIAENAALRAAANATAEAAAATPPTSPDAAAPGAPVPPATAAVGSPAAGDVQLCPPPVPSSGGEAGVGGGGLAGTAAATVAVPAPADARRAPAPVAAADVAVDGVVDPPARAAGRTGAMDVDGDDEVPVYGPFGYHAAECGCKFCRLKKARAAAMTDSQFERADAALLALQDVQDAERAAAKRATSGPLPAGPEPAPERSYAQLARSWATHGMDPDSGGGVLPGADRTGLPPAMWAERGRTRSSAGGAGPKPKKLHVLIPAPRRTGPKSVKPSPKSKYHTAAATPAARQRHFRTAHVAGPPQDHERYAADGLARRAERLDKATPSQPRT